MNEIANKVVPIPIPNDIIEYIISHVPSPPGVGKSAIKRAKENIISLIRDDLAQHKLVPVREAYDHFITDYIRGIHASYIDAGTPVGITCATSISAPITQISFNTHKAVGTESGIAQSFSLIRNILTGSKTDRNSTMKIMLKHPSTGTNLNNVLHVGTTKKILAMREYFEETTVKMLIESHEIIDENSPKINEIRRMMMLHSLTRSERFTKDNGYRGKHIMELKLNTYRMYSHKITMYDVARTIEGPGSGTIEDNITCIWRSQRDGYLYVLLDENKLNIRDVFDNSQSMIMIFQQYILARCNNWVVKGIPGISVIEPVLCQVCTVISKITEIGTRLFRVHISKYLTRFGASILDLYNLFHKLGYNITGYDYDELYIDINYTLNNFINDYMTQLKFINDKLIEKINALNDNILNTEENIRKLAGKPENDNKINSLRDTIAKLGKELETIKEEYAIKKEAEKISFNEHEGIITLNSKTLNNNILEEIFKEIGYDYKITKRGTILLDIDNMQFFNMFKNIVNKYTAEYEEYLKKDLLYDEGNKKDKKPTVSEKIEKVATAAEFYYINTIGVNFEEILWRDDIDIYRSYPSNPHRIAELFGIDAATLYLIIQFNNTLSKYAAKVYLDPRHILLQFYMMTNIGQVDSLSITGINRRKIGPLAAASTGHAMSTILNAGVFSTRENPAGVTTAVCIGQANKIGTGMAQVFDDYDQSYTHISERDELFEEKISEVNDLSSFLMRAKAEEENEQFEENKLTEVKDLLSFLTTNESVNEKISETEKVKITTIDEGNDIPITVKPKQGFKIIKPGINKEENGVPNITSLLSIKGMYIIGWDKFKTEPGPETKIEINLTEENVEESESSKIAETKMKEAPELMSASQTEYRKIDGVKHVKSENCTQNIDFLKEYYRDTKFDEIVESYTKGHTYGSQNKIRTILNNYNILYDNNESKEARVIILNNMFLSNSFIFDSNKANKLQIELEKSYKADGYETMGCIDEKVMNDSIRIGKYVFKIDSRIMYLRRMGTNLDLNMLLLRYKNRNYASGITFPKEVYKTMYDDGFTNEAFSSPLDSGLIEYKNTNYCSLYPDTDSIYGSLGDFFSTNIVEYGNQWIVNPPQIHNIYEMAKQKIISIYNNDPRSRFVLYSEFENDDIIKSGVVNKTIILEANKYKTWNGVGKNNAKIYFIGLTFSDNLINKILREFEVVAETRKITTITEDIPPEISPPPELPIPKTPTIKSSSPGKIQLKNPPRSLPQNAQLSQTINLSTRQPSQQNIPPMRIISPQRQIPSLQPITQNVPPSRTIPQNITSPLRMGPTQLTQQPIQQFTSQRALQNIGPPQGPPQGQKQLSPQLISLQQITSQINIQPQQNLSRNIAPTIARTNIQGQIRNINQGPLQPPQRNITMPTQISSNVQNQLPKPVSVSGFAPNIMNMPNLPNQ